MEEKIRMRYVFLGRVQGVGFRYRAQYAARALNLTGWVHNRWDGAVEMEVQGTRSEISELLKMLYEGSFIQITDVESEKLVLESESSFRVR